MQLVDFMKQLIYLILSVGANYLIFGGPQHQQVKFMVDLGQKGWKQFRLFYFINFAISNKHLGFRSIRDQFLKLISALYRLFIRFNRNSCKTIQTPVLSQDHSISRLSLWQIWGKKGGSDSTFFILQQFLKNKNALNDQDVFSLK